MARLGRYANVQPGEYGEMDYADALALWKATAKLLEQENKE